MENDVSSGSPSSRLPVIPAVSEAARTMARASAKSIRGTPAAKKRASKAGKWSWAKRTKEAFEAGYLSGQKGDLPVEQAWRVWVTTKHGGLAMLFGWVGLIIGGLLIMKEIFYDHFQ